jgi:ribulose-5-phosphate 4-epimerase/fuculose-1-phosphate aldolase
MLDQIAKYTAKMVIDGSARADRIAFAAQDDVMISGGDPALASLAESLLSRLDCLALVAAAPSLPFADLLIRRTAHHEQVLVPRDTETRTFLHDIPLVRSGEQGPDPALTIATLLGSRKGVIYEGIGIIAAGALTVEQAYINWSSVFHSTYIKYLEDLLDHGFLLEGERELFARFRREWLPQIAADGLDFGRGPFTAKDVILAEIVRVGSYTVQRHLVDSFFGNISYSNGDLIYISQTAASLDELSGCIDPVPFENSSTVGITASSELGAHRAIFETTGCRAILHGHPRFAVVMSMQCDEKEICAVSDCWKECVNVRTLENTPIVAGEIGAGGIAKNIPPVIGRTGSTIVYGHGVFSIGKTDFRDAFQGLVDVENRCREAYFKKLDETWGR